MAESDPKSVRPVGQNSIRRAPETDEDPLVELARIVSEDSGFHGARDKMKPHRDEPVDRNALSADLEAELLQELETSFASRHPAVRPASRVAQPPSPQPPSAQPPSPRSPAQRTPASSGRAPVPAPPRAREPAPLQPQLSASDDSDDLLRSIEEQLGQFERRAQIGRPAVERSEQSGERREVRRSADEPAPAEMRRAAAPPREPEPIRVAAKANPPAEAPKPSRNHEARRQDSPPADQGDDDAPESVLRPLADVRDGGASRADRPARGAPPQPSRAVRPGVEAVESRRPQDRPAETRMPLRRRDEPTLTREVTPAPVRRQDRETASNPVPSRGDAAGWDQIVDDEPPVRAAAAPADQDWGAPAAAGYRVEPSSTFEEFDDAAAGGSRSEAGDSYAGDNYAGDSHRERLQAEGGDAVAGNAPGWNDPRVGDTNQDDRPRVVVAASLDGGPPQFGRGSRNRGGTKKALLAGGGLIALLLIGGAALTFFWKGDDAPSGPPPVIAATEGDVKVEPPPQEQPTEGETVGEAVYNRVAGTAPDAQEQVVDGAEEPREISRIVLPPPQAEADQALVRPVGDEAGGAAPAPATAAGEAADPDEIGLRRVRTYVVRPDGTIAATNAAAAPPAAPAQPQQVAAATPMEPVSVPTVAISEGGADPGSPDPAVQAAAEPGAVAEPVIRNGDASEAAASTTAPDIVANAPVDLLSGNAAPATGAEGFVVQVSSQRSLADAQSSFEAMRRRFPSVLGNLDSDIQEADLGAKGVYYRVRVGPWAERADALGVCEALQAAGGSCFVTR